MEEELRRIIKKFPNWDGIIDELEYPINKELVKSIGESINNFQGRLIFELRWSLMTPLSIMGFLSQGNVKLSEEQQKKIIEGGYFNLQKMNELIHSEEFNWLNYKK